MVISKAKGPLLQVLNEQGSLDEQCVAPAKEEAMAYLREHCAQVEFAHYAARDTAFGYVSDIGVEELQSFDRDPSGHAHQVVTNIETLIEDIKGDDLFSRGTHYVLAANLARGVVNTTKEGTQEWREAIHELSKLLYDCHCFIESVTEPSNQPSLPSPGHTSGDVVSSNRLSDPSIGQHSDGAALSTASFFVPETCSKVSDRHVAEGDS
ncbi:hypothetical protein IAT40_007553 [Kwoniella sp. CBS 6097]